MNFPLAPRDAARLLIMLSKRTDYKRIHQAADAHLEAMTKVFSKAFAAGRAAVSKRALRKALEAKSQNKVLSVIETGIAASEKVLKSKFAAVLSDVVAASGTANEKTLAKFKLRTAGNEDQPRDKNGQWTSGGDGTGSSEEESAKEVAAAVDAVPRHASDALADYPDYEAGKSPLNQVGESTRSPAWTDEKPAVEEAFGDYATAFNHGVAETMAIDDLSTYQTFVSKARLRKLAKAGVDYDKPVGVVFEHAGKQWLVDGNHRTSLAKLSGRTSVKVIRIKASPLAKAASAASDRKEYTQSVIPAGLLKVIAAEEKKMKAAAAPAIKGFAFDAKNPKAIQWVKEHALETIDDISETTRDEIRVVIENAFEGEFDVDKMADKIADLIGDDARAEMIARTETMRASNEGQKQLWDQATDAGLLTGNEKQEWITTPDDKLCPICEPMDGDQVGLDEKFDVDGDKIDGPPAHPNCRCTIALAAET